MATYRTDLMDEILTSPEAQKIIGQVSPIYGAAFVGLWLFQVIGYQLDDMEKWSREFEAETVPQTATWSLDYWEQNYGIPRNPYLSVEQRRARIISKIRDRAPMNPAKLAKYVTSVTGVECEIIENTGKNAFKLVRHEQTGPLGLVRIALNEAKPAHLIYKINSTFASEVHTWETIQTWLKIRSWVQTAPDSGLNTVIKGPPFQTRESVKVYSLWPTRLVNKEAFTLHNLSIRGRANNWGMEIARFNGRRLFDGSIRFDQQVHRDNLLGLEIRGLKWQTRETIRLVSQWPAKVSNTEHLTLQNIRLKSGVETSRAMGSGLSIQMQGAAWQTKEAVSVVSVWPTRLQNQQQADATRLQMRHRASTEEQAVLKSTVKGAARQTYGTAASLIINRGMAFDGSYLFDGSKQFNANVVEVL